MTSSPCPLCDRVDVNWTHGIMNNEDSLVQCRTCGRFRAPLLITEQKIFEHDAKDLKHRRYLLSARTKRSAEPLLIDRSVIADLRNGFPADSTVVQKIELAVRRFADASKELGAWIPSKPDEDYPYAYCKSATEWTALLTEIISRLGYLETGAQQDVRLTLKGWQWLESRPRGSSDLGFVAMWFAADMAPVRTAILQAISESGYSPTIIDLEEFTGGVMDEIKALIRQSRFVVADFTGNRGGVYNEAGFADGLGIPVIYTASEECFGDDHPAKRVHFDVAHLNFLTWRLGELPTLTVRLRNRILAILGPGPHYQRPGRRDG